MFSDPPLSVENIPNGQWLCHTCRMTQKFMPSCLSAVTSIKTETTSDHSRPNTPGSETDYTTAPSIPNKIKNLRKRSSSRVSVSSDTSIFDRSSIKLTGRQQEIVQNIIDTNLGKVPLKPLTPMDELIKAASLLNPRQFELPREMNIYCQFPGSDKSNMLYLILYNKCYINFYFS